jgi:hypothetical protein
MFSLFKTVRALDLAYKMGMYLMIHILNIRLKTVSIPLHLQV